MIAIMIKSKSKIPVCRRASHTGKTVLAQKLLEKYKYPYLSTDHLKMNPDNRWIKRAAAIPWDEIEECYAELFPGGI